MVTVELPTFDTIKWYFRNFIGNELFTRQDYLRHNKEISTATASRDLKEAVDNDVIEKEGEKRLTKYRYKN